MVAPEGVAAVIDPQRDVGIYIETAARNGWTIQHVIETHLHADFDAWKTANLPYVVAESVAV